MANNSASFECCTILKRLRADTGPLGPYGEGHFSYDESDEVLGLAEEALQLLQEHQAAHGPATKWENIYLTPSEQEAQIWRIKRDKLLARYGQ